MVPALTGTHQLDLGLLRDLESVVDHNPEIPDGAFELRVPEEKLDGSEVLRASVNQLGFRSPNRVCAVCCRLEPNLLDPTKHNPGVLPCTEVRRAA